MNFVISAVLALACVDGSALSESDAGNPVIDGGKVYWVGVDLSIRALDRKTGREKWTFTIDGQDVKLVSNRLIEPIPDYDPAYDFVFDGVIDSADVNFISNLAGSKIVWEDITSPYIGNLPAGAPDGLVYPVDTENHIVYGFTDHFSIFRGR